MGKREEIREKALGELQKHHVLMLDGHFDFGNGYHGRVYLNPHQLFCQPSIIWRFAQDLIDVLPAELLAQSDVGSGPATGGALLWSLVRRGQQVPGAELIGAGLALGTLMSPSPAPVPTRRSAGRRWARTARCRPG